MAPAPDKIHGQANLRPGIFHIPQCTVQYCAQCECRFIHCYCSCRYIARRAARVVQIHMQTAASHLLSLVMYKVVAAGSFSSSVGSE